MGNQQFHRVVIRHEAQVVNGCFLRGTQVRREDVVRQMLRQEQGGFDVLYLELLQQSLQLWHLGSRNVPRGLGEGVKFLQLHGQVGEVRRIGDDPVIINDRDALPALHAELFLCVQQLCLCCGKIQCHRARIANVGMQSEREPEEGDVHIQRAAT